MGACAEVQPAVESFPKKAREDLEKALKKDFRRLHPDDIKRDLGFESVAKEKWFVTLLEQHRKAACRAQ